MDLFTHRVERSEVAAGDHIYTWRTFFAYSHHGIYVGGSKVVHFTQPSIVSGIPILFSAPFKCSSASSTNVSCGKNVSASCTSVSSTCTIPHCGFQQMESGVVLSCLDCFLDGGQLYRFEYGVSDPFFLSRIRSGTCTTVQSDPPEAVIHRAIYLLQNGFGNYDVLKNNCEDFALYCKTGLLHQETGSSGQTYSAIFASSAAIVSLPLKLFMSTPDGSVLAAGMYSVTRYATDIGVRTDVTKVKAEELTSFRNQKSSKKSSMRIVLEPERSLLIKQIHQLKSGKDVIETNLAAAQTSHFACFVVFYFLFSPSRCTFFILAGEQCDGLI